MAELMPIETPSTSLVLSGIFYAQVKGTLESMEYPLFSVSKTPDKEPLHYKNPKLGLTLSVIPGQGKARPTIYDRDVLLFIVSQLVESMNRGVQPSDHVVISGRELATFCKWNGAGGAEYRRIRDALDRMESVQIISNQKLSPTKTVDAEGKKTLIYKREATETFRFISKFRIEKNNGAMGGIHVWLAPDLYQEILRKRVLTYNDAYFDLSSPMHRRLYELSRKFVGNQPVWVIGVAKLYERFGCKSDLRKFRFFLKEVVKEQPIPDYCFYYQPVNRMHREEEQLTIMFDPRGEVRNLTKIEHQNMPLIK